LQREFHIVAVVAHGAAKALLGFADPILDCVLVQHETLGRGLIAAPGLQEDQQCLAQTSVVLVIGSQARERAAHPAAQQVRGSEHHRDRRHLGEGEDTGRAGSGRERHRLGCHGLQVAEAEPAGALGGVASTPIINRPEVAIVGVNKIVVRPVWRDGGFVPRKTMNLSSSFDHRVVDGYDAASFIQRLRTLIEAPATLFIEE